MSLLLKVVGSVVGGTVVSGRPVHRAGDPDLAATRRVSVGGKQKPRFHLGNRGPGTDLRPRPFPCQETRRLRPHPPYGGAASSIHTATESRPGCHGPDYRSTADECPLFLWTIVALRLPHRRPSACTISG